jgi:hypothetical protein
VQALAYRAELALALEDPDLAAGLLVELDLISLTAEDREALEDTPTAVEELRRDL